MGVRFSASVQIVPGAHPASCTMGRLVDWYRVYGATTPSHLGRKLAGPLCTVFSTAFHVNRHESPPVARNGNGLEMADKFRLKTRIPRNFQGHTPPTTHSDQFQLFHDSSRQQYCVTVARFCSYSCFVLLKMGDSNA